MVALEKPGPLKNRLDALLVLRGMIPSREQASRLIMAGRVRVNGSVVDKPGKTVKKDVELELVEPKSPYVSRAGEKLASALDQFSLSCSDCVIIDVGASTGGFTDCVLQRGAKRVYAIDVGYGQLDQRLREDPRVVVMDRKNIRFLSSQDIPELVDVAVVDVSFISLKLVLPVVVNLVKQGGLLVVLVKPQFEAGKGQVGRGGIVKDEGVRNRVKQDFLLFVHSMGLAILGIMDSPILGKKGNREMLVVLQKSGSLHRENGRPKVPIANGLND